MTIYFTALCKPIEPNTTLQTVSLSYCLGCVIVCIAFAGYPQLLEPETSPDSASIQLVLKDV